MLSVRWSSFTDYISEPCSGALSSRAENDLVVDERTYGPTHGVLDRASLEQRWWKSHMFRNIASVHWRKAANKRKG